MTMDASAEAPPVLGLTLGGGIARGWAHIGVLRALDAAGIRPQVVCGTSVGALAGAAHLSGRLDVLETWARGLNRQRMITYLDFGLGQPSLISGRKLGRLLDQSFGDLRIEDLGVPFGAVCVDLFTGHEVCLSKGRVSEVIQASYALPGVFPPRRVGRHMLVDGALVNPVPVSVCRALGAEVVIAVNLNGDIMGKTRVPDGGYAHIAGFDVLELMPGGGLLSGINGIARKLFRRDPNAPSLFGVMMASLNIVLDRTGRSRLAAEPPDVLIAPKLGHIGSAEFDRAAEMIDLGYQAAEEAIPDIREALRVTSYGLEPGAPPATAPK
jgi:NTE family protein